MKFRKLKMVEALALSLILAVGVIPVLPKIETAVQAAATSPLQYATKEELLSDYNLNGTGTIAKIKFGTRDRNWMIAGADGENTLALLSTSAFCNSAYGNNSRYSDSTIATSLLPGYLSDTSYFSDAEKSFMKDTTISTEDWKGNVNSISTKLYLPTTKSRSDLYGTTIYVGKSNDIAIDLKKLTNTNGFMVSYFWLRSPNCDNENVALMAIHGYRIGDNTVNFALGIAPAFDLDMSSVLFASAVPAVESEGSVTPDYYFTLRYASSSLGTATINSEGTGVAVADVPKGTYLVVQNSEGAWTKSVCGTTTFSAGDICSDLSSFKDCKVWLETSDTVNRITTATAATQKSPVETETIVESTKTQPQSGLTVSDGINIEGYQVSTSIGGSRVVGSVEPTINNKLVLKWGFIYAINQVGNNSFDVTDEDMYVGSTNSYVTSMESTTTGTSSKVYGSSATARYFVRTMLFGTPTVDEYTAGYKVRAYALLEDGTYVYSDVNSYSIYDICDSLYQEKKMNSFVSHEYLYNNILKVVTPDYQKIEYDWSKNLVKP